MIFKDKGKATFGSFLLGRNMVGKHLLFRIFFSLGVGFGVPIVVYYLLGGNTPSLFFPIAIPIVAIASYFVGYPWCMVPLTRNEVGSWEEKG